LFDGESGQAFREAMCVDQDTWVRPRLGPFAGADRDPRNPDAVRDGQELIAGLLEDFAADR
jgi:hypothetical protein